MFANSLSEQLQATVKLLYCLRQSWDRAWCTGMSCVGHEASNIGDNRMGRRGPLKSGTTAAVARPWGENNVLNTPLELHSCKTGKTAS